MTESDIQEIVSKTGHIRGFLWAEEAALLAQTVENVHRKFNKPLTIVEIGSYAGKSTCVLGLAVKLICPESRIYAIDPHKGQIGTADKLEQVKPTATEFLKNMYDFALIGTVCMVEMESCQVDWPQNRPIHLLFIDALHDYKSVHDDFHHFESFVEVGGLVVFHDYTVYEGVKMFVDEILTSTVYERVYQIMSMVVLRKLA